MSLLNTLFNKRDQSIHTFAAFWIWFKKNEKAF
jgi:hypothetical protein